MAADLVFKSALKRNEYKRQKQKTFLGSRVQPVREADKLTAICEPSIYTMWDLQRLTTL
jgi:hypothetical protein